MPLGLLTKDPEKTGVSSRNKLQPQNGSIHGRRQRLRTSTRHKAAYPDELRNNLTEDSCQSDEDETESNILEAPKKTKSARAMRDVVDTEDEDQDAARIATKKSKKRDEERQRKALPPREMDTEGSVKTEVDSADDDGGLRRGTRVRKPNYRLTDYDLAVRPKDQIKDASLNSADEGLIDENSGNSTEDSSSDDDSGGAGPSSNTENGMRRQRGRPRKYPRREGAVSVSSKRDRSPSQYEEEVPRKRLRAPDGTFMRKEIKDEIVTEDESVPQPQVDKTSKRKSRNDRDSSTYESAVESIKVVTRSKASSRQHTTSNSPPLLTAERERGYVTDSETYEDETKRGPGRPRKHSVLAPTSQKKLVPQPPKTPVTPKINAVQSINMPNLQASTSHAVNTPQKQNAAPNSANVPRLPHRKNQVSEKECAQLFGPDHTIDEMWEKLPTNRKLRSGREINTEDEASDNGDEPGFHVNYDSAPEGVSPKKLNMVQREPIASVAEKAVNQIAPMLQSSQTQKMARVKDQAKPANKTSPSQKKEKSKVTESVLQQLQARPSRNPASKEKTENTASGKVPGGSKEAPVDNRKVTIKPKGPSKEVKCRSASAGKAICVDTPSTTGSSTSFDSPTYEDMPQLEMMEAIVNPPPPIPHNNVRSSESTNSGSEDKVPPPRHMTRSRAKPIQKDSQENEKDYTPPPDISGERYENVVNEDMPTIEMVDATDAQDQEPYPEEFEAIPVLCPRRRYSASPQKSNEQPKQESPVRKPSPRKEVVHRAAPSLPSKALKKSGVDKKESEIASSSKARQRNTAVQTIKTRTNSKTIALTPVLSQLQTIAQLPATPESQSTPELFEVQHIEPIASPRRSPRKNSLKSPAKEEINSSEEQANPKGIPRAMRSRNTGETTPVDFATRKRKADHELSFVFNPQAKRCRSNTAGSTTDEIPNSSSKSTESACTNSTVTSAGSSIGRERSRKDYTPKKVAIDELRDITPDGLDDEEKAILREFHDKKPEDYAKMFQSTLKMYKELGDRGWRSFMRRNLGYVKAVHDEGAVLNHRIGEDVPPLLYEKKVAREDPAISRNTRDKSVYLHKMIDMLVQNSDSSDVVRDKYGIDIYQQFSLGTLAKAEILNEKVPGKGKLYIYKQLGESEVGSSIPETLVESVEFTSLRDKILPGRRIGWTDIYLGYEIKGKLSKLHPITHTTFPLLLNENNKSTVDLINQFYDPEKYDKLYIVARVAITEILSSCNVKGHTLRSRNGGEETSKGAFFPKHGDNPIEKVYWGAALIHEPEGLGYRLGSLNIELIDRDVLQITQAQRRGFLLGLLNEIKKNNTNPFLVTEVKRRPQSELSSSENEYYTDSGMSQNSGNSGGPARALGCSSSGSHAHNHTTNAHEESEDDEMRRKTAGVTPKQLRKVIAHHTLNALMGEFKPRNGQYINDKEMLKDLFADRRILQDNKKMSIINKWMPLAFPNKIKYRFLCHIESTHDDEEKEPEHSSGTASSDKENKCTAIQFKKLNWIATDQNDNPGQCIICGWSFPDLYSLMLHYNTTYPRLAFVFSIRDKMFEECRSAGNAHVVIDVMVEPRFQEIHELLPSVAADPLRRISSSRFFITRSVTKVLKATMRRDNTIFARFLSVPEIVDETVQYVSRFIDTDSGVPMAISDEVGNVTTKVPNPGYEALHERLLRILQDFIDIDQDTKNFMSSWNKVVLAIGRYNQAILGAYMEHRLFLDIFWDVLNSNDNWKRTFCIQTLEYADNGALTFEESRDLWRRVRERDYKPLADGNSTVYREMVDHVYKKNRTMRRHTKKQKIECSKKSNPCYRMNLRELDDSDVDDMVSYMYWNAKAVPKLDGRRLFMADPLENIPNNTKESLQRFFHEMEPIELREGEVDMYRT